MAFELAFVDSISATPTYRLNLHDTVGQIQTLADGTEFGMPDLDRAVASTMLTDGAVVPSSAYGNRMITLHLSFPEADLDAAASRLQAVARELDRPTNILRYRAGTSAPVFFRTFRSSIAATDWDPVVRRATVSIMAEPFALGLREDLPAATVNNDPAAGSNGLFADFTGIKGDVETPAYVKFSGLNSGSAVTADIILGTRRHGTPSSMPFFFQAESFTTNVDTSVPGTDALMSGAANNYLRTTFATDTSLTIRMTYLSNFPAASGTDFRGTFRLYAILRGSGTTTYQIKWWLAAASPSFPAVYSDVITFVNASNLRQLIDLGQITFPVGSDPVTDGYSGVEKTITGGLLGIYASRPSGSGTLDWDYFVLVPDDAPRGDDWFYFSLYNLGVDKDVIADGPRDMVYPQNVGATTMPMWYIIPSQGRIPSLSPNVTNRWIVLRPDVAGTNSSIGDVKTRTTTITVSYWPRYVYVRPVSS